VLDDFDRPGSPHLAIAADRPASPARTLVRTAAERVREHTGREAVLPSVATQLVDLGVPYAPGEQGPFLAEGIAAVAVTGEPALGAGEAPVDPGTTEAVRTLRGLGRATEGLVASIDASVGAAFRTPDSLFIGDRAASGWAVRLMLVVAVVPFGLGVVDLLVRSRRRRLPLAPAVRGLRARLLFWLYGGLVLWLGALLGVFPTGAPLPLAPHSPEITDWPVAGLALLTAAIALGWLTARRRLVSGSTPSPEERLAGYAVALAWLGVVATALALVKPYALVFVLPSLYAWLWLPVCDRLRTRAVLYSAGLVGPTAGLLVLGDQVGLGLPSTFLYVASLATVGYVSAGSVLFALAWLAAAAQLGALALGRYEPYAGGATRPPPGPIRASIARVARYASAR
jgi:hypothetical protein